MHARDSLDSAIDSNPPRSRSALFPITLGILGLLLAWFTLRNYSSFDWVRFAKTFATLRFPWLYLGVFLSLLSVFGRAVRWQAMMLPRRSSLWNITFASYIGFSAIVLFGRAGELVRPYLIARRENTEIGTQAGVWVLERLYDLILILFLFGIGIHYARNLSGAPGSKLGLVLRIGGWVATICGILAAAIFYFMAHRPEFCRQRFSDATTFLSPERQAAFLRSFDSFLEGMRPAAHWPTFWKSLALTILEWAIILGAGYSYFQSFPPASRFSMVDICAYWGFISFGSIIQLPGIGGGVQIASALVLTELFRMPLDQAAGFSLLIWAGTSLTVLFVGIPLAFYGGLSFRKLRGIGKETAL